MNGKNETGAPHDALTQIRADVAPAAHEALGYTALAYDCLNANKPTLAADMLAAAAASLAPRAGAVTVAPLVSGQTRTLQALSYCELALDAMSSGNVITAAEMFRCAATALREATA